MHNAAAIAHTFNLDPVAVLDEHDPVKVAVRAAAHEVVVAELAKQNQS